MITVIVFLQFGNRFLTGQFLRFCQFVYILRHLRKHFLLGDAADARILIIHRDIGDIVQLAEDAELRELGDAREEDEAELGLAILQWAIEVAHRVAKRIQLFLLVRHIQHRRVVFVDKHHHLLATLLISGVDEVYQTVVASYLWIIYSPFFLLVLQKIAKVSFQFFLLHVLATAHVEVEHGIFRPLCLQFLDGKSLEEVFLALEVTLHRSDEKRLAETARATQEEVFATAMRHAVDIFRLVDIKELSVDNLLEGLYAYGI